MELFHYSPLQPGAPHIRLLRLLPYHSPQIQSEIFDAKLLALPGERPDFEAVSYAWGSTERVERIQLNGKTHYITESLHSALQQLRPFTGERIIWVDALCINQDDSDEKGDQVRQMGNIFKLAENVIFWLGKATHEIDILMSWLRRFEEENSIHTDHAERGDLQRIMIEEFDIERFEGQVHYRKAFTTLWKRPWFSRIWVIQEIVNARSGIVGCGEHFISAHVFTCAATLYGHVSSSTRNPLLDRFSSLSQTDNSWWSQKRGLDRLMFDYQKSQATDERDKVYALLDISYPNNLSQDVRVDYTLSIEHLARKVTRKFIESSELQMTEILEILAAFTSVRTICLAPPYSLDRRESSHLLSSKGGTINGQLWRSTSKVFIVELSMAGRGITSGRLEREDQSRSKRARSLRARLTQPFTVRANVEDLLFCETMDLIQKPGPTQSQFSLGHQALEIFPLDGLGKSVSIVTCNDYHFTLREATSRGHEELLQLLLDFQSWNFSATDWANLCEIAKTKGWKSCQRMLTAKARRVESSMHIGL